MMSSRISCKEPFQTTLIKPAKNSKQLLCGFFYGGIKSTIGYQGGFIAKGYICP